MNKNTIKVIAGVLGCSLVLGTAGAVVAADAKKIDKNENVLYEKADLEKSDSDSVYVLADSNGNTERIILDDLTDVAADSKMPVDVSVKYFLDGKEISPSDLLGKSGHVVIRYDYVNNAKRNVLVEENTVEMNVPYTVATAVVLDGERFSNVTVNSGKVVDDGDRYAVVGIALPGVKENLAVSEDKFDIPEYTEIEADVKDFKLDIAYTLCSGSMFATMDIDMDKITENIDEKMTTLTDAMTQLIVGSEQLAEGSSALSDGVTQYTNGVAQVAGGLNQIDANSATLQAGAKAVFESLLATANSSLQAAGVNNVTLTIENYEQTLNYILSTLTPEYVEAQARKEVEGLLTQLLSYQAFYDGVVGYTNGVSQVTLGAAQLNTSSEALVEGANKLSAGSLALSEGLKKFNEEGVEKIVDMLAGENTLRAKAMLELAKEENSTKTYVYKLESIR